jgi:hypothetical protein
MRDGRVVADVSFKDRFKAKTAGFDWDPIQRHWYTYDDRIAARAKWKNEMAVVDAMLADRENHRRQLAAPRKYLSQRGWKRK